MGTQDAKHTPGPWKISGDESQFEGHVAIDTVERLNLGGKRQWDGLAQVVVCVDHEPSKEGEANAQLIAAAPELLEALRPFANYACDEPHVNEPSCHNCIARAAIVKATTA